MDFLTVSATTLGVVVLLMVLTAVWSRIAGRVSVIDVTWGSAFVVVAVVCALFAGDWRSWLLVALTGAWGGRLAWHILRRSHGAGEDPRYAELLDGGGFGTAVRKVFLVQGLAIWLISLPLQAAAVTDVWAVWIVGLGVVVWAVGLYFEVVGDAQLAAYKARPKGEKPPVMDQGLWGWTRHPNYFGDACLWWGLWLVGGLASGWLPGLLTIVAPVAMTYFIRNVTGAKLLERTMSSRPGWEEYAARVPLFFPRPPALQKSR